jgi:hypothetical protein
MIQAPYASTHSVIEFALWTTAHTNQLRGEMNQNRAVAPASSFHLDASKRNVPVAVDSRVLIGAFGTDGDSEVQQ